MVRFVLMLLGNRCALFRWLLLASLVVTYGCAAEMAKPDDSPVDEPSVDIGVPAGDDGLFFESLEPGGELRLQTFGQGGTHVLLGLRATGFGTRAFAAVTLRNLESGATVLAPAPVRPQLFVCADDGGCELVPLLVMTAGLTETGAERDGVRVEVRADVTDDIDDSMNARATREALLSTADL